MAVALVRGRALWDFLDPILEQDVVKGPREHCYPYAVQLAKRHHAQAVALLAAC